MLKVVYVDHFANACYIIWIIIKVNFIRILPEWNVDPKTAMNML